jgi:hypothetical protein
MAEALWARFGARPQLLAASVRFAPQLNASRALEWSARLRSIALAGACPLLARAARHDVAAAERVRAGVTAHAAFSDPKGAEVAITAAPLVPMQELAAVLSEVALIDPALVQRFAAAAAGGDMAGPDEVNGRAALVARALAGLGYGGPSAQSENGADALSEDAAPPPQLAMVSADR